MKVNKKRLAGATGISMVFLAMCCFAGRILGNKLGNWIAEE